MKHITKWKDDFGTENLIMMGSHNDVYIVNPDQKDKEGNSKLTLIPKKTLLEFVGKMETN